MSGQIPPSRRLPANPNLEQLRKQARDLLTEYRTGSPEAIAEVRQFEHKPEPPEGFALHDALRILARAYGFESWPKLRAFVDGANVATLAGAVRNGDLAHVRTLLHARPELTGMDMSGGDEHRALHYAVLQRNVPMVKLLMEAGSDARKGIYPHRDATSALAIARDRGYIDVVEVIEEEERLRREEMSCPNATVSSAQELVNDAIERGDNEEAIRLLQADGSLIQACDRSGGTPLHTAAEEGNEYMVDWLLKRRAPIKKEDIRGLTALDRAALAVDPRNEAAKHFPCVARQLLEAGSPLTIRGAVALGDSAHVMKLVSAELGVLRRVERNGGLVTVAVKHGQIEMVKLLLDLGADVDERILLEELEEPTISWGYPLWYAALAGDLNMTRLLLDRGADPNANVYASGWPLRNAWGHSDDSVKRLLLARGAKIQPYMVSETHDIAEAKRLLESDSSEQLAQELAWSAADNGCAAIVELALKNLHWAPDDKRWHWIIIQPIRGAGAAPDEHLDCMSALLRHGVDPKVSRFGQTAMHFAAARHSGLADEDRARFASMLIDYGARLNARDDLLQSTPLGWACRWGRPKMVELLIKRGAPVNETDAEPWATPLAWAEKMSHLDVIVMLQRHL